MDRTQAFKHCGRDTMKKLAVIACCAAMASALVVAPVGGQEQEYISIYTPVPGPGSPEDVKKRALWTNCEGVSLESSVDSDTDLSEESVWNAAEAALRSAGIYSEDPRWVVRVFVWGKASAHYVAIEFLDTLAGWVVADRTLEESAGDDGVVPGDLDFLAGGSSAVMTYRVQSLASGRVNADRLLAGVRRHMDTFLVDYLRAHADCAEGSL